jgi:hypothetical protein
MRILDGNDAFFRSNEKVSFSFRSICLKRGCLLLLAYEGKYIIKTELWLSVTCNDMFAFNDCFVLTTNAPYNERL